MRSAGPGPAQCFDLRRLALIEHHLLEIRVTGTEAEIASAELWSRGALGVEERPDRLVAAFTDRAAAEAACAVLGGDVAAAPSTTGLHGWRDNASVIEAGPFAVHPPWLEPPTSRVAVCIDPGDAFGSGSHPSTQLALGLLGSTVGPTTRLLDVGCGSGVLAVAGALLGASVVAVDNDPTAIDATRANAAINGVADRVDVRAGGPLAAPTGSTGYDAVVVNVTIDIHDALAPAVISLAPRHVIAAGLLVGRQEERAVAAYRGQVTERLVDGEWVALRIDL